MGNLLGGHLDLVERRGEVAEGKIGRVGEARMIARERAAHALGEVTRCRMLQHRQCLVDRIDDGIERLIDPQHEVMIRARKCRSVPAGGEIAGFGGGDQSRGFLHQAIQRRAQGHKGMPQHVLVTAWLNGHRHIARRDGGGTLRDPLLCRHHLPERTREITDFVTRFGGKRDVELTAGERFGSHCQRVDRTSDHGRDHLCDDQTEHDQ